MLFSPNHSYLLKRYTCSSSYAFMSRHEFLLSSYGKTAFFTGTRVLVCSLPIHCAFSPSYSLLYCSPLLYEVHVVSSRLSDTLQHKLHPFLPAKHQVFHHFLQIRHQIFVPFRQQNLQTLEQSLPVPRLDLNPSQIRTSSDIDTNMVPILEVSSSSKNGCLEACSLNPQAEVVNMMLFPRMTPFPNLSPDA